METTAFKVESVLMVRQWSDGDEVMLVFNFAGERRSLDLPFPRREWRKRLDSADPQWAGPGPLAAPDISSPGRVRVELPATSFVLYQKRQTSRASNSAAR
jgi:maltooligosyltrehalose trehalohydrolase